MIIKSDLNVWRHTLQYKGLPYYIIRGVFNEANKVGIDRIQIFF